MTRVKVCCTARPLDKEVIMELSIKCFEWANQSGRNGMLAHSLQFHESQGPDPLCLMSYISCELEENNK